MSTPKPKRRRWPWIVAAGGFVVLLIALFASVGSGPTPQEEFEATLARLKSEGFAVSADDLWTDCPEDENAWPLWKETFGSYSITTSGAMTVAPPPPPPPTDPRRDGPSKLLLNLLVDRAALSESDNVQLRDYFSATSDTLERLEAIASNACFSLPENRNRDLWEWETPRLGGVSNS